MANARIEFLEHIESRQVLCVQITKDNDTQINLEVGYSAFDFDKFLAQLNFEYDGGYGSQELYGVIWYKDGTWSERGEYDGSEWWEHKECPVIPDYLKEILDESKA